MLNFRVLDFFIYKDKPTTCREHSSSACLCYGLVYRYPTIE